MKPDIKGLMKLGRTLARLPRSKFNQTVWWEEERGEKGSCGTVGCVAGWAATLFPHRFKKEVYGTATDEDGTEFSKYEVVHRRTGYDGVDAFANGFRIPLDEAERITDGGATHKTPKAAARAIFRLVERLKRRG